MQELMIASWTRMSIAARRLIRHGLLVSALVAGVGCADHHTDNRAQPNAQIATAAHASVKLVSLYLPSDTVEADDALKAWVRVTNVGNALAKEIPVQLRAASAGSSRVTDVPLDQGVAFDVAPGDERKLEMTSLPAWRRQVGIRPGSYLVYALIPDDKGVEPSKTIDTTAARKQVTFR
jgi:hypothetical protein